jgi:hypothetical protein
LILDITEKLCFWRNGLNLANLKPDIHNSKSLNFEELKMKSLKKLFIFGVNWQRDFGESEIIFKRKSKPASKIWKSGSKNRNLEEI